MPILKIDHIAVVVEELDGALAFWQDALGLTVSALEQNTDEAVNIAFLPVGASQLELIQPTSADSGVAKYLAKRGSGIHHLCLAVDDIHAALAQLAAHGVELINDTPRTRHDGTQYAFVHPKSTGGVLVELYQYPTPTE
jgi:methylmalonyl-CoA/ethylmalonyl-CoA epimerase